MSTFVALKEGENELRTIVTVICAKGLRKHWRLADQNTDGRTQIRCLCPGALTIAPVSRGHSWHAKVMSALPPKADICSAPADVRFGPEADMAQIEISLGPPINYNYRVSLPVRKIATR